MITKLGWIFKNQIATDDRTPFTRTELFHRIGQTVSKSGGVLQQLHPQRKMVHPSINSSIQPGRSVVLRQHRFFECRQSDQNTHRNNFRQSSRHDGTTEAIVSIQKGVEQFFRDLKRSHRRRRITEPRCIISCKKLLTLSQLCRYTKY